MRRVKNLIPYEFTLTNTCDSEATYYINLETITSATKKLSEEYLKASLRKKESEVFSNSLNSSYINLDKVLPEASNAYKIYRGVLKANEVTTFSLNIWLDENTPALDEVMNATYEGKITISTSYKAPLNTKNMMMAMEYQYSDDEYFSYYLNKTYTKDGKYGDGYSRFLSTVVFENKLQPYEDALEVVDFSVAQDKSVLGYYLKENNDSYELHIQADGKIKVNPKASYYFLGTSHERNIYPTNLLASTSFVGIENLDMTYVTDMSYLFAYNADAEIDLSWLDTNDVLNMSYMFYNTNNLTSLDISNFDTSNVTNMNSMFSNMFNLNNINFGNINTQNVTDMSNMFYDDNNLISLDLNCFDTRNVRDMSGMFRDMDSLTNLNINNFNTKNVTNMSYMFYETYSLGSINLKNFNTNKVTNMSDMFSEMRNITSLDLSDFDTSNVINMSGMFNGMDNLTSLDLSSFNTPNVTDMSFMFSNMNNLTNLNISNFDTSKAENMSGMFRYDYKLTDIIYGPNFIHKENADITSMYTSCPASKPTHESWNGLF